MTDENLISLQPGTVVAGRYEVVKCLGAGSMGLVYACRHRELSGHLVAIKVLFPEVAQDNVAAARFRNEIVASYGVSHINVVRAYEYFRDGDLVAYTMEYVGGGDLADRLGDGEPIPISEAIRFLDQISAGVQAIHNAGIIHRDLKPENILLTPEGDVKITDFGIARTGHGPKLTEHGGVVGTIDYVSPEYLEKGQVDARSDIYAVGVLAYEMITGESPFRGDSVIATMTMRLRSDPTPPSKLRTDCPVELDSIVLKAMHRNPEERYQQAMEIHRDLLDTFPDMVCINTRIDSNNTAEAGKSPELKNDLPRSPTISNLHSSLLHPQKNAGAGGDKAGSTVDLDLDGGRMDANFQKTQVINQGLANIAAQYDEDDTIEQTLKMESVLSSSYYIVPENKGELSSGQIPVARGGLDRGRIRTLSQSVGEVQGSGWLFDAVLLVVAILIALGVGLAVMNFIWPDLFEDNRLNDSGDELIIYDNDFGKR